MIFPIEYCYSIFSNYCWAPKPSYYYKTACDFVYFLPSAFDHESEGRGRFEVQK